MPTYSLEALDKAYFIHPVVSLREHEARGDATLAEIFQP